MMMYVRSVEIARCSFQNIVQYLGCHYDERAIHIFLEFVPGGSIRYCLCKLFSYCLNAAVLF